MQLPSVIPPKRPFSIDGVVRAPQGITRPRAGIPTSPPHSRARQSPASRPSLPAQPKQPAPPVPSRPPTPAAQTKPRRAIPERLQLPLIIIAATVAGFGAQSYTVGEIITVLYGIIALVWKISSRTTFCLALLSMVATALFLVLQGNIGLAQNFATYTFLLLVVGVISLNVELKKEGGRVYSRRKQSY